MTTLVSNSTAVEGLNAVEWSNLTAVKFDTMQLPVWRLNIKLYGFDFQNGGQSGRLKVVI